MTDLCPATFEEDNIQSHVHSTDQHNDSARDAQRWTKHRAKQWHERHSSIVGCNFLPSTAVNFIAMWHPETFDQHTIKQELELAAQTGLNAIRTNIPFIVWEHDPAGLLERMECLLELADRVAIKVVFCLFDDCEFSGQSPEYKIQAPPIENIHNSRATGSPGREIVLAGDREADLRIYVQSIIGHYAQDSRILFWDLYNEPGNRMQFLPGQPQDFTVALEPAALRLMELCFSWAREMQPMQPLSVAAWRIPELAASTEVQSDAKDSDSLFAHPIDQRALEMSDVLSFHAYCGAEQMRQILSELKAHDRPILCTEWLARPAGSTVESILPLLQENQVGAFHWGLVNGQTQTNLPWPFLNIEESHWFHDLFDRDHQPYNIEEIALFRRNRV